VRVVLDANVLVSAVISAVGPPREIVTAWVEGRFELVASPALGMRTSMADPIKSFLSGEVEPVGVEARDESALEGVVRRLLISRTTRTRWSSPQPAGQRRTSRSGRCGSRSWRRKAFFRLGGST
jgi:hypothetical protein